MEDWVAKAAKEDVDSWYLSGPRELELREGVSLSILQSERFLVEAVVVFNLVQSPFLERSFDAMQNVICVMLLWPEEGVQYSIVDRTSVTTRLTSKV